jgi:alkanesulfonate monooxygenase SsuD/methylene tetrahydromethanopterin reductase-like flavin-dependent oxidoreductase (luciferase family)
MTGVAFTSYETRVDTIVRLARQADALALARVQVAETDSYDAMLVLAEIAAWTSRIEVGTLSARANDAQAAMMLQRGSGGRFTLGVGGSIATLTTVRARLSCRVPLALAAHTPEAIRIAGGLADEWAPSPWPRSKLAEGRALLRSSTRVAPVVPVALGPNRVAARRAAAWWLRQYATREPRLLRRFASTTVIETLRAADRMRARDLPASAEALAHDLTLFGTYDEAPALIAAWYAAGADRLQLVLPPEESEGKLAELVDVVGTAQLASAA